jgi:hypothetical protein
VGLIRAAAADPDLFGIEDENAGNSGHSLFDACQCGSMDSEVSIFL